MTGTAPRCECERVLVLAPVERDRALVSFMAGEAGMQAETCAAAAQLAAAIREGTAGAAVIAQEGLDREGLNELEAAVSQQPDWSDFPFIFVAARGAASNPAQDIVHATAGLGNVVIMERPLRVAAFTTALRSALRARRKQHQVQTSRQLARDARAYLELALDAAELGTWDASLETGEMTVSRRLLDMFGFAERAPRAEWMSRIHPDDRERVEQATTRYAADRHSAREMEFRVVRPDGAVRWILARVASIDDGAGRIRKRVGFAQDITERKTAEEAVRRSEVLYRGIARAVPDAGVWAVDTEMRYIVVEGALVERLGLSRRQLEGRRVEEVLTGEARQLAEPWFQKALAGESSTCETELSGYVLWTHFAPLRDEAGAIVAAMALILDVTERKRVEAELRHAQKMESLGVLAGGIAHDFNNLLTTILGNASLAQTEVAAPVRKRIGTVIEASEKAATLTRQILAYAGKGRFNVTDVDLSRLILSSTGLMRVSIPKNVDFVLDVPSGLPPVRGDASQIQQVLTNLVINAAEAIGTEQSGRVSVRAGVVESAAGLQPARGFELSPGPYVFAEVSDTGAGMDEETKAKIFDPFFTTKFAGRGLGLAAVQGILRSHKGGVAVRSAPGEGSTFTVYLPVSTAAGPGAGAQPQAAAGRERSTVLVADDEPDIRDFIQAALERAGHAVLLAANGREALDVLERAGGVDLVVLDVVMPVEGGGEALAEIRERWPRQVVLVTSGYNREEAGRLGNLPAGVAFIQKPYTAQALAEAVANALGQTR